MDPISDHFDPLSYTRMLFLMYPRILTYARHIEDIMDLFEA